MKRILFIASIGLFTVSFASLAQTTTPQANKRSVSQQVRIEKGHENGTLSNQEYVALKKQQKHIKRTKRRAKADGVVTRKERATIHRKQKRANKNIKKQKVD